MVIIEGADLVGKTTLALALAKKLNDFGWPHVYRHCSKPPECWRQEPVACYARLTSPYIVQDRFNLSEIVYAPIRGSTPHFSVQQSEAIQRNLRSHCSYLIVITAANALLKERFETRPEMFNLRQIIEANQRFYEAAKDSHLDGYKTPVDLHIHCSTITDPWPTMEMIQLRTYTARLTAQMMYPGGKRIA